MRATISFEAEVSRVKDIMRSLVLEESNALQDALVSLEKATSDRIVEGISDALVHINGVARQLEQYQQMMTSFERARFDTMLPQPAAGQLGEPVVTTNENQFNNFVERMSPQEEEPNDPEEG